MSAKSTKILSERVKQADYARNIFRVEPDRGTEIEELLDPGYWVHVAAKFGVGDKVEVFPVGGEYYAEFLVVAGSRVHLKLVPLLVKQLAKAQPASAKDGNVPNIPFKIEHKGSVHKWSVIRVSDKEYVKDGFATRDEAAAWLEKNEAEMLKAAELV